MRTLVFLIETIIAYLLAGIMILPAIATWILITAFEPRADIKE